MLSVVSFRIYLFISLLSILFSLFGKYQQMSVDQ